MTEIALTIVTDRPKLAQRALFGVSQSQPPEWLAVVSSIDQVASIPTGAPVMSLWFGDGSPIEAYWREERAARAFDIDHARHAARIEDWINRRDAYERALVAEYIRENAPDEATPDPEAKASVEQRCDHPTIGAAGREMRVGEAPRGAVPATSDGGRDGVERHAPNPETRHASRWS